MKKYLLPILQERVLPGQIIKELVENDRLVGGINKKSTKLASNFYKSFVDGEVIETSAKTAEMAKIDLKTHLEM